MASRLIVVKNMPPSIDAEALHLLCGSQRSRYFVVAVKDDGPLATYMSGGHKLDESIVRQFFDATKFRQVLNRLDAGAQPMLDDALNKEEPLVGRHISNWTRPEECREIWALGVYGSTTRLRRKRPRLCSARNEETTTMTVSPQYRIKIGDSEAVWTFYEQQFKKCHQAACKLIAKAWIKAVEPKKQSTHPYTGSDEKAPDWWPKPYGPTKDDKVRHKEPDHLYRRERIHLLAHILRLVLEPNSNQHSCIRKQGLNVTKLKETTAEALSSFFIGNDLNAQKRPYLNKIFRVAHQEERYRHGEISGSMEIDVLAEEKPSEHDVSETEESELCPIKDDEDIDSSTESIMTSATTCPSMLADVTTGDGFFGVLPVIGSQFLPPTIDGLMPQHSFVANSAMQIHGQAGMGAARSNLALDIVSNPRNATRRPCVSHDFTSSGVTNIYVPQLEQRQKTANGLPLCSFTAQQRSLQAGAFVEPTAPMDLKFITASYEEDVRHGYNATESSMLGLEEMTPGIVAQLVNYKDVSNNGRA